MKPVTPARRRADEFAAMVESASATARRDSGTTAGRHEAELAPLLELVAGLRSTPAPAARPEFVSDLRGRLLLAAETDLVPAPAEPAADVRRARAPRRTARERRLAVAVGGFAIVTASASMSVAAQSALPGDTLYQLKIALEDIQETAVRGEDDKGATMLDHASSRLDEVDQLSRSGDQDAQVIAETLEDFTDQAVEASDVLLDDFAATGRESSIEELRSFTATSLDALTELQGLVPVEARGSLIEAARVIDQIAAEALVACPACTDLPALQDALNAASVTPLLENVLGPETAPTRPARVDRPDAAEPRAQDRPAAPSSDPVTTPQVDEPAAPAGPTGQTRPTEQPEVTPPADPGLPTGPRPDTGQPGGDDPLGSLVTGLDDPVGDVLTGTTELVDDLLTGGLGGAGGKPKK